MRQALLLLQANPMAGEESIKKFLDGLQQAAKEGIGSADGRLIPDVYERDKLLALKEQRLQGR